MGRRGPAAAPTAIKLAKGERRPSQVNYHEPVLDAPESHEAPSGLEGAGLEEWKGQIDHLSDRGVLTSADLTAFEDYCRALTELRRFEAKAKDAGEELAIAKGYQGMVVKLRAQVNQLRQQCGLTPSSRSGVKASKSKDPAVKDPASRYLNALKGGKGA
jgi:P27 family predicted phage terminase small subunit